jgi:hypothetical protein
LTPLLFIRSSAKLPIPFIFNQDTPTTIKFKWTIGTLTRPDPYNPDEYSNTCIEETFYPNSEKYNFTNMINGKLKNKRLDLRHSMKEADTLLKDGWVKSSIPCTDTGNSCKIPEIERRGLLKWDTIVHKTINKQSGGVFEPFLVVHSQGRNDNEDLGELVDYAVAVTIEIPKFEGDAYKDVLKAYNKLQPLEVRAVNQILVPIS